MVKEKKVISWQAQEYVQTEKNIGWYVGLIVVGVLLVLLSVLLKAWTFTALIVISVMALIVYTVRPPRMIKYKLDEKGLTEGDRLYEYDKFKAFGISIEGEHCSVILTPRKRFSPRLTMYFPQENGEEIVNTLGARLPMEDVKQDLLDKLVKFLRI